MKKYKIKGHTDIVLTDEVSGEKKIYSDDNMVTNAPQKLIDFISGHSLGKNSLNIYSTHWYNLFGGLVLFDSALPEDADEIWPPAGAKPVGYAQIDNTESYQALPEWGVYNPQESDTSADDTKVLVFDFATSHANKRIASVALTHRNAGMIGMGVPAWFNSNRTIRAQIAVGTSIVKSKKGKNVNSTTTYGRVGSNLALDDGSYVDFCIDAENDKKYMFRVCQDGLSIIKHGMNFEKFDIFYPSTEFQEFIEETYSETFTGSHFYHCYNMDEKMLYFWTYTSNAEAFYGAIDIYIHKFDMTNKVLTKNWKRMQVTAESTYMFNNFVVTSSGIYICARFGNSSTIKILKYDTTTGEVSTIIPEGVLNGQHGCYGRKNYVCNGLIHLINVKEYGTGSNNYYDVIIDTYDDSVRYTNLRSNAYQYNNYTRGVHIPPIDKTQMVFGTMLDEGDTQTDCMNMQQTESDSEQIGNMFTPCGFLSTINNLQTPVVKTSTMTMKIVYTITVEQEE